MTTLIKEIALSIAKDCLDRANADNGQRDEFQDQFTALYMPHARAALSAIRGNPELLVRELEWEGEQEDCYMYADSVFGRYEICVTYGDEWSASLDEALGRVHGVGPIRDSSDAALKDASIDYTARALSLLNLGGE